MPKSLEPRGAQAPDQLADAPVERGRAQRALVVVRHEVECVSRDVGADDDLNAVPVLQSVSPLSAASNSSSFIRMVKSNTSTNLVSPPWPWIAVASSSER